MSEVTKNPASDEIGIIPAFICIAAKIMLRAWQHCSTHSKHRMRLVSAARGSALMVYTTGKAKRANTHEYQKF
jgi:hypothetical protein